MTHGVVFPRGGEDTSVSAVVEGVELVVLLDCAQAFPCRKKRRDRGAEN